LKFNLPKIFLFSLYRIILASKFFERVFVYGTNHRQIILSVRKISEHILCIVCSLCCYGWMWGDNEEATWIVIVGSLGFYGGWLTKVPRAITSAVKIHDRSSIMLNCV